MSCRAKHDGHYRDLALLVVQPLAYAAYVSLTRHAQYRHGNSTWGGRKFSARAPAVRPPVRAKTRNL